MDDFALFSRIFQQQLIRKVDQVRRLATLKIQTIFRAKRGGKIMNATCAQWDYDIEKMFFKLGFFGNGAQFFCRVESVLGVYGLMFTFDDFDWGQILPIDQFQVLANFYGRNWKS